MKRLILTTTILLCAVPAHARDALYEYAMAKFYNDNCIKVSPGYLKIKTKELYGCERNSCKDELKAALDSEQDDFNRDKIGYCERIANTIKCDIFSIRHGNAPVDCRTMKILKPGQLPSHS